MLTLLQSDSSQEQLKRIQVCLGSWFLMVWSMASVPMSLGGTS